mmetsp:Transcript_34223/g.79065  ORF Transcript_34223/g.79065 Transcript_34223/m.79065 type:complete len:180 (+) Transcript_34223:50-589(+)
MSGEEDTGSWVMSKLNELIAPAKDTLSSVLKPVAEAGGSVGDTVASGVRDGAKSVSDSLKKLDEEGTPLRDIIKEGRQAVNSTLQDVEQTLESTKKETEDTVGDIVKETAWINRELAILNQCRREYPTIIVGVSAVAFATVSILRGRKTRTLMNLVIGGGFAQVGVSYLEIQDRKAKRG